MEIIKSWYPDKDLSDSEALAIYDRLLKLYRQKGDTDIFVTKQSGVNLFSRE